MIKKDKLRINEIIAKELVGFINVNKLLLIGSQS